MTHSPNGLLSRKELAQHVAEMEKFDDYFVPRPTDGTSLNIFRPSSLRKAFEAGTLHVFKGDLCAGHPDAVIEREQFFDLNAECFYRLAQLYLKLEEAFLTHESIDIFVPVTSGITNTRSNIALTKSACRDENIPYVDIQILATNPMLNSQDDKLIQGTMLTVTCLGLGLMDDTVVLDHMSVLEPLAMNLEILNPPKLPVRLGKQAAALRIETPDIS